MIFHQLNQFRLELYQQIGKAKDALFDLMDAVLTSGSIQSFVSLSQSPVFQRQWSSVYAALQDSRLSPEQMMKLVVKQVDTSSQPVLAGDSTVWKRPNAPTVKERTYEYDSTQGQALGHKYSTLAWLPSNAEHWSLTLCHERVSSFETASSRGAFQLKRVTRKLDRHPLALYDRAYGNAQFLNQTAEVAADILVRLASNRCVYGAPPAYSGRGAPRKHGHKMKLNDPDSWSPSDEVQQMEHPKYGRVRVTRWSGYHFKNSATRAMEILRVEVLEPVGGKRKLPVLWLAWIGETLPDLHWLWQTYLRRFDLEHWYRFAKQRLYWTQPQLSSTQAMERWSLLVVLMYWQLWLARQECEDRPLPWQSAQTQLTPGRVAQGFASILVAIGTPAKVPKPRGKSPGRQVGERPPRRTRYPTVKKWAKRSKKPKDVPKLSDTQVA